MSERDMTDAGREWMAGELPAHEYFAMVRRSARPEPWWVRLWRRWRR